MNILIVGCGYIGTEVGALWKKKGHSVTVTTHNPENIDLLFRAAQKSVILKGDDMEELVPLIANNDLILVEDDSDLNTAKMFRHLALEMDLPRQLIYMSSSSIYGDHGGMWVDEMSELKATEEEAKNLIEIEKLYASLDEIGWHVCVLRLSEIYGPGRELSKRVMNFENHILPGTGHHYTNMIHKFDCVTAINFSLKHNLEGIFNLSDDDHTPRKELYDLISHKFSIPRVKWDPTHTPFYTGNKRVSNHKIKSEGFTFQYLARALD